MSELDCPQCHHSFDLADQKRTVVVCPKCLHIFNKPAAAPAKSRRERIAKSLDEPRLTRPATDINMEELIDMTAMVDIVFFLLIFFLVTSMSEVQSTSQLPQLSSKREEGAGKGTKAEDSPVDSHDLVISIGEDDVIRIEGTTFRDKADLLQRLKMVQAHSGHDLAVMIVGHGNASHGTLAAVLDTAYEAGMHRLRVAVTEQAVE